MIQVIKLADDQLKDIVKYWQTTTTPSTRWFSVGTYKYKLGYKLHDLL